jgi:hypothetical protein
VRAHAPAGIALTFESDLSYTLDPVVWGQGFATEAVRRVLDYSRDVLRLSSVISAIQPQNARSRRVAERCGARAAGQMEVVGLTWIAGCTRSRQVARLGSSRHPRKRPDRGRLAIYCSRRAP